MSCIALAVARSRPSVSRSANRWPALAISGLGSRHRQPPALPAFHGPLQQRRRPYGPQALRRQRRRSPRGDHLVAFALLFFVRPMGFGMVGGLVAFQVLLMANALGALWRYQRLQLAGLAPATAPGPSRRGPGGPAPKPRCLRTSRPRIEVKPMASCRLACRTAHPGWRPCSCTFVGLTFDADTIWAS